MNEEQLKQDKTTIEEWTALRNQAIANAIINYDSLSRRKAAAAREFERILQAQERVTREEERKKCAEIFRKETEGLTHATCGRPLQLGIIYNKILNQNE